MLMAFTTSVSFVNNGTTLQLQDRVKMDSEERLEDWIATDLSLLGEPLLLIRHQVYTTGGPLDILAMDGDGVLVIAELKRDRTPREVVAQVIDYASWVRETCTKFTSDEVTNAVDKLA
jgi:RecB family endonuclease NucS